MDSKNIEIRLHPDVEEYLLDQSMYLSEAQREKLKRVIEELKEDPGIGLGPPLSIATRYYTKPLGLGLHVGLYYEKREIFVRTEILIREIWIGVKMEDK